MQIIDTYEEIEKCFCNINFSVSDWERYVDNISPALKDKVVIDARDYNFNKDILPVWRLLIQRHEDFVETHNSFVQVTDGLGDIIRTKLGTELEVSIIFYLGLCNGAGWATELEGKPVVLLGVEKIVELSWCNKAHMFALIYHELGHIWHYQVRQISSQIVSLKEKSVWQLYTEGMAMYIEQLLCGDVGYYLGCEMIKILAGEYSLFELGNMDLNVFESKLREEIV